jgi:uncharacterized protein
MSQTLSLFRLQQVDSQIDRLQGRLKETQRILEDDSAIRKLKEEVETAETRCKETNQDLLKAERNVQDQIIKIEQTQSSLYGTKTHSPKELQDLQNDVAALKRYLNTLEDLQLDAMQASENAEADQQYLKEQLKSANLEHAKFGRDLEQEQGVIRNDLEKFFTERNAIASGIPTAKIDLYDQLRQQRRGVAVAVIGDNACGACGSTLSLAQIQSARSSGEMILCPSCGRILYGN